MSLFSDWISVLTIVTLLGSGLIAGVFFAFSTFVMKGLGQLKEADGIAAMQSINLTVINPVFLGVFMGTALASLACVAAALLNWSDPGAVFLLSGGMLYFIGSFMVTGAFNIPRNNALAALNPADPAGPRFWRNYLRDWTAWNHVRMFASLAALVALLIALYL